MTDEILCMLKIQELSFLLVIEIKRVLSDLLRLFHECNFYVCNLYSYLVDTLYLSIVAVIVEYLFIITSTQRGFFWVGVFLFVFLFSYAINSNIPSNINAFY